MSLLIITNLCIYIHCVIYVLTDTSDNNAGSVIECVHNTLRVVEDKNNQ